MTHIKDVRMLISHSVKRSAVKKQKEKQHNEQVTNIIKLISDNVRTINHQLDNIRTNNTFRYLSRFVDNYEYFYPKEDLDLSMDNDEYDEDKEDPLNTAFYE